MSIWHGNKRSALYSTLNVKILRSTYIIIYNFDWMIKYKASRGVSQNGCKTGRVKVARASSSTRKLVTDGLLLYYPVPVISVTYPVSLGIRAYRYANYTCACVSTTTYCPPLHPSAQELGTLSGGLPENRPWWKPLLVCVNNCREYKAGVVVCHTSTGCKYGHDIEIWCNFGNKMSHQWHVDN